MITIRFTTHGGDAAVQRAGEPIPEWMRDVLLEIDSRFIAQVRAALGPVDGSSAAGGITRADLLQAAQLMPAPMITIRFRSDYDTARFRWLSPAVRSIGKSTSLWEEAALLPDIRQVLTENMHPGSANSAASQRTQRFRPRDVPIALRSCASSPHRQ
jgi:hypothetical protein